MIAGGLFLATSTFPGIRFDSLESFLLSVLLIGLFDTFLKPWLLLLALPFVILSFGLGVWCLNALLLLAVAALVQGFYVHNFAAALVAALIIALTSWSVRLLFGAFRSNPLKNPFGHRAFPHRSRRFGRGLHDDDDVIDI